jgi:hypothetical protein
MANFRSVHTKYWSDHAVEPLTKESKLLFLYLMTNSLRTSSGLYPITRRRMAQETSMTEEEVDGALDELTEAGFVRYDDEKSVVLIINAVKYLQRTSAMRKSVVNDLIYVDSFLTEEMLKHHPYVRQWEEWTEDAQFIVDSRSASKEWEEEDGGLQF